jgi:hypothetical protein
MLSNNEDNLQIFTDKIINTFQEKATAYHSSIWISLDSLPKVINKDLINVSAATNTLIDKILPAISKMLKSYKFEAFQKSIQDKLFSLNSSQEMVHKLIPENNNAIQKLITDLIKPILPAILNISEDSKFSSFREETITFQSSALASLELLLKIEENNNQLINDKITTTSKMAGSSFEKLLEATSNNLNQSTFN